MAWILPGIGRHPSFITELLTCMLFDRNNACDLWYRFAMHGCRDVRLGSDRVHSWQHLAPINHQLIMIYEPVLLLINLLMLDYVQEDKTVLFVSFQFVHARSRVCMHVYI